MNKNFIEKQLKKYLKKKISYTTALLVSFLITGNIILGNEKNIIKDIKTERKSISNKIKKEREVIKEQIKKNEKEIAKYKNLIYELILKGDYYSKPIYGSNQVILTYENIKSGKNKDRTENEFAETIDAVNKSLKRGRVVSTGNIVLDKIIAGNGTVITGESFTETVDVGVNINPVEPILPNINPTINVAVNIPQVEIGQLPQSPTLSVPTLTPPSSINPPLPGAPGNVTVTINQPSKVEKITVTAPTIGEVKAPSEKNVEIKAPTTPNGFVPSQIVPPQRPAEPIISQIVVPNIIIPYLTSPSSGNGDGSWFWNAGGDNGLISQVIITDGNFDFVTSGTGTTDPFTASVTNYTAKAPSGYSGSIDNVNYINTSVGSGKAGMVRIVGSSYTKFGENSIVNIDAIGRAESGTGLRQFIHYDPHGDKSASSIDSIADASLREKAKAKELVEKYKGARPSFNNSGYQILALNGEINLTGNTMALVGLQGHSNSGRNPMILHTGNTVVKGKKNVVYAYPNAGDSATRLYIASNYDSGNIEINGNENFVMLMEKNYSGHTHNFENSGVIDIKSGDKNIGVFAKQGVNNGYIDLQKPITISSQGTNNIGVYHNNGSNNTLNSNSVLKIDITNGTNNVGLLEKYTPAQSIAVNEYNISGGSENIAVLNDGGNLTLNGVNISISGGNGNFGIFNKGGNISSNGEVKLLGGENNVGIGNQVSGNTLTHTGNITLAGENNIGIYTENSGKVHVIGKITDSGTGNILAYSKKGDIRIDRIEISDSKNNLALYATGASNIFVTDFNMQASLDEDTATNSTTLGAAYADASATINIERSNTPSTPNIVIKGRNNIGFGAYANNATIDADRNNIKVENGVVGLASIGTNSSIQFLAGKLEYSGKGYAVYSDGQGQIDLTNAIIDLSNGATATEINLATTNPIHFSNTIINIKSNDVVVFNLLNANNLNSTGLENQLLTLISGSTSGITVQSEIGIDKYKTAAVDGGTITIGNLDKTGTGVTGETQAQQDGNFFYNRFLGQRLVATTTTGSTISAKLTSEQASKYNDQVVALEMNSSNKATTNAEAAIKLVGSTLIADRTDAGAGAIGAFINYGQVSIDGTSNIKVEKETDNAANEGAVGVYAVNGSEVTNSGNIEVGGAGSIGILGMAYRENPDGDAIINEFGSTATNQGKVNITNSSNITLDGDGSIGIYADNNNVTGTVTDSNVSNTGTIKVGNSGTNNTAVGIYAKKSTISNTGTIETGNGGVGIYATNGSNIRDLGILKLGSDGIGVMLDGTSTIASSATTLTLGVTPGTADTEGKVGLLYKGTGSESQNVTLGIDAQNFDKGVAIYADNMSVTSSGNIQVGKDGVGIYLKGTNTATNQGIIDLVSGKTGAVGMYTNSGNVVNDTMGTININDASQIGVFASGNGSSVENKGNINIDTNGATGIYVKDGASVTLSNGNINFNTNKNAIGTYSENANVTLTGTLNFTSDNENKNIYVYSKDSTVTVNGNLTVNGNSTPTTTGNKTVGIYLENTGTGSTLTGIGSITAQKEAIGLYSKGNNTLALNIVADGDKTTGVFIDEGATISGTVTIQNATTDGAVGIYGTDGEIKINNNLTANITGTKGTGIYLSESFLNGGTVTINNTGSDTNIGVYYTGTSQTNASDIALTGTKTIGIYAAEGINLTNSNGITTSTANNIATYIGERSTLTSNGNINMSGTDNIGIFTGEGTGVNNGTINISGTSGTNIGMIAQGDTGKNATVENKHEIVANANVGMYIAGAGNSTGKNSGKITTTTGTGIYLNGANASFDGTGGSIETAIGTAVYLKDTVAGKVTSVGNINITGNNGVGVFAENSVVDFDVTTTGNNAIGVYGKGTTSISKNVTIGDDSIGVYVADDSVSLAGANIVTGSKGSGTPIGVLLDGRLGTTTTPITPYELSGVNIDAKDGVGVYAQGGNIKYSGTITTTGNTGIGIYLKSGSNLTHGASTINISNGATGIYVDNGTIATLGSTDNLTFAFGIGGGIGVYNAGGTITFGNNITMTGSGSLAATLNGDLNSTGNITVGEGGVGLLGKYDNTSSTANTISSLGTITATSGGIGMAAIKDATSPSTESIVLDNSGAIIASDKSANGNSSIGIYSDLAEIKNTGSIEVGTDAIGIFADGTNKSITNGTMIISGENGIGVYVKGATSGLISNNITSRATKTTGVILDNANNTAPNLNVGTVTLGNGSIGVLAKNSTTGTIDGTITVGNSIDGKSSIGVALVDGGTATISSTVSITTGDKGLGVYANNGSNVTIGDLSKITVGKNGVYVYSDGATLNLTGNITADDQIGIYANGGTITGSSNVTSKNGGVGIYIKGSSPTLASNIDVQKGKADKYSIGVYYDSVSGTITLPSITQNGDYTVGSIIGNSTASTSSSINLIASNQVGIIAKSNSSLTIGAITVGNVDNTIGVYGKENSQVTINGNITVGNSSAVSKASIGAVVEIGSYQGTGDLNIGANSIGVYAKNPTTTINQNSTTINVRENGVGLYGEGGINLTTTNMTLADNNSIGVYAKESNAVVSGDISVGKNTSIGIVSEGSGDVTYTGNITIGNKGVGIYKNADTNTRATSTITTSTGNWIVGDNAYGIYAKSVSTIINNAANMSLGEATVGIYSHGANIVNNSGNIIVGKTTITTTHEDEAKHLRSIGIFASAGTQVNNTGTITINKDHSIGIYGDSNGTVITNNGNINVDNGGIGIFVRDNAIAVNKGNITLGSGLASCESSSLGMIAYAGGKIINEGTITVNEGTGMLAGLGASFENKGVINVANGVGIQGPGALINSGTINILPGGTGIAAVAGGAVDAELGSVKIDADGNIHINGNYTSIGGHLSTVGNIIVDGAYVDVTTNTPLFSANNINGTINILPNFALTGNGISYEIDNFVNTISGMGPGGKITPVTSPLFMAKVTNEGKLVIVKRPYADITAGEQFEKLDKGLDNILANSNGAGKDAEILKGLNTYLEGLPDSEFPREAGQKLSEFRGDIYSTIQERMQNINHTFDKSFEELEKTYNLTKDSGKYSVIYTKGDYKDPTIGIDDYDYNVKGLLYMKEYEGAKYKNKYGYTLGFTGSEFEFKDGGSKEEVYSLRGGIHKVTTLNEEGSLELLSRLELGYNRHIAKRKLNLQNTFDNKGEYNTYTVSIDNKLTKDLYKDFTKELSVYGMLNLEYGKTDKFSEKAGKDGGLLLDVKENNYISSQVGIGTEGKYKLYTMNDIIVNLKAKGNYMYELGDNYKGNEARLKDGKEGYYKLITPEEKKGILRGTIGIGIEKGNQMGINVEMSFEKENSKKEANKSYSVRFNYVF